MDSLIKRYGFLGLIRLSIDTVSTKLFISAGARIVRRPRYIRGMRYIDFGRRLTTGVGVRLDAFPGEQTGSACIIFGDNVQLNDYVHIAAVSGVTIGDNVLIASKVFISDHNHGGYGADGLHDSPKIHPIHRPIRSKPIVIGNDVWIGEFVSILPGVTIGKGSVIGAASVVTKNIPPYTIALGVPAREIKKYDFRTERWEKLR